jgi:tripartite-type tricarboxylate transporter receptor subunit TctC
MAGFKFLHVPYKGASQILGDVMGGQVQAGIGSYTSLSPLAQAGKLQLIAAGLIVANESAEFFQDYIKSEYEKYGKIVRSIGLEHKL